MTKLEEDIKGVVLSDLHTFREKLIVLAGSTPPNTLIDYAIQGTLSCMDERFELVSKDVSDDGVDVKVTDLAISYWDEVSDENPPNLDGIVVGQF